MKNARLKVAYVPRHLFVTYLDRTCILTYCLLLSPVLALIALVLWKMRVRFLTGGNLVSRIGHTAEEPDLFVKAGLLGMRPSYKAVVLAPARKIANRSLLSYWTKYLTVVTNPILVRLLWPFERFSLLEYNSSQLRFPDGRILDSTTAIYAVQRSYEAKFAGRPLLTLRDADRARGRRCLENMGVPGDGWFICLHVRESGYLPHLDYHSYRDVDVSTYFRAVEWIVGHGGWVIRMGDPTMTKLPPMKQVIDYAHSELRCDWMDVFCLASCKFFLGTTSGPFVASSVFGVPCATANFVPMGYGPYSSRDIFIPKLYASVDDNRCLAFREVLATPLRRLFRTEEFQQHRIKLIDNSPEDILDLTKELFERMEGDASYTDEDERLQTRFRELMRLDPMYETGSRVGRNFLRKYRHLLLT